MSTFEKALAFTLKWEGGDVDDAFDPGGRTSRGITQKTYDYWRHKHGLQPQDVFLMTNAECESIYDEEYWQTSYGPVLEPPIALMVFDCAVNCGVTRAIEFLQSSCGATVDGVFGPETLDKQGKADPKALIEDYHGARQGYYRSLVSFPRFGNGWLARNDACLETALSWLGEKSGSV